MSKKEELLQKGMPTGVDAEKEGTERVAPVQSSCRTMVYIGPTFRGATKGTVYNNGAPPALKEAVEKKPVIGQLLVPVTDLPVANRGLTDSGSALSRMYRIAEDYLKGE